MAAMRESNAERRRARDECREKLSKHICKETQRTGSFNELEYPILSYFVFYAAELIFHLTSAIFPALNVDGIA